MRSVNKFQIFTLLFIGLGLLAYAGYFVWGEIGTAQSLYIEKQKEIISIEKRQEQISQLKKELEKTAEKKIEVLDSLIARDDVLKVIERIEGVAKRERLLYEVKLLGEITKESIDREILAIRRSRAGGKKEAIEEVLNKLSNINFQVNLTGEYLGIIRFLEGIGTLPYYAQVDRFELLGKKTKIITETGEEQETSFIEASINLIIFTR